MSRGPTVAVALAAGRGTRMGSALPKVLHPAAGRPLLEWVLALGDQAECDRLLVVVGHGADEVRERFADRPVEWIHQNEQSGTGHAVLQVEDAVPEACTLLVLTGDAPLLRLSTVRGLLEAAEENWGSLAVATLDEPGSLGRVEVGEDGSFRRCVEVADASPEELQIRTVNAGFYALPAPEIFDELRALEPDNRQGEIYLPAAIEGAVRRGRRVTAVEVEDHREAWGVNTPDELAAVSAALIERHGGADP